MPAITSVDPEYWRNHTVGPREPWRNDCVPLTKIKHVTHIEAALTIAAAGSISPGLVYDESRLNTERLTVIWISPNNWTNAGGSRYGNVEFVFDWDELLGNKNVCRIEVRTYRPIAFRLLVTSADLDARFERYDP